MTRRSKARCCSAAMASGVLGREVVLRLDRSRGRPLAPPRSGPRSRTRPRAGATMSRGARSPAASVKRLLRQDVGAQDRRQDQRRGWPTRSRAGRASCRVKRAIASTRWVSMGWARSITVGRQWVPTSWPARSAFARAAATMPLTTLPSARPRVRGDSQPMTLPRSRARRGAGRGDRLVDEGARARPRRAPRAGTRCRIAISASSLVGEVLAPTRPERLDRLATRLDLAGQDGEALVVGQGRALLLLDVVRGVHGHAQDITTQRVTAAHGGRDVGLDAISKGHGSGNLGRRSVRRLSGWCRAPAGAQGLVRRRAGAPRLSRPAFGRSSCAWLPCACASLTASRSARVGEPRRGCRSAGSSC